MWVAAFVDWACKGKQRPLKTLKTLYSLAFQGDILCPFFHNLRQFSEVLLGLGMHRYRYWYHVREIKQTPPYGPKTCSSIVWLSLLYEAEPAWGAAAFWQEMQGLLTTQTQNFYKEQIQKETLTRLAWKSRHARLYPSSYNIRNNGTDQTQLPQLPADIRWAALFYGARIKR